MAEAQRFFSIGDLNNMPKPRWLIEGMFEKDALVMLAGPSYSYKSFLLLGWLVCLAIGRPWFGREVVESKVGYALGEGKSGLMKRIAALVEYLQLTPQEKAKLDKNFKATFDVPQLASKNSVKTLLDDMKKEGFTPEVLAVDTFARSFVGLDENSQKDTGMWVDGADSLRQLGMTVIFLHHTKKNTENGVQYRGSTAIMAAMDTALTLTRSGSTCKLKVEKQKDHDEGPEIRFNAIKVGTGQKDSCVLVPSIMRVPTQEVDINGLIAELIEDGSYTSDTARAEALSKRVPGISVGAAKNRISRAYREFDRGGGEPDAV